MILETILATTWMIANSAMPQSHKEMADGLQIHWDQLSHLHGEGLLPYKHRGHVQGQPIELPALPPTWRWSVVNKDTLSFVPRRTYAFTNPATHKTQLAVGGYKLLKSILSMPGQWAPSYVWNRTTKMTRTGGPSPLYVTSPGADRAQELVPHLGYTWPVVKQWLLEELERGLDIYKEHGGESPGSELTDVEDEWVSMLKAAIHNMQSTEGDEEEAREILNSDRFFELEAHMQHSHVPTPQAGLARAIATAIDGLPRLSGYRERQDVRYNTPGWMFIYAQNIWIANADILAVKSPQIAPYHIVQRNYINEQMKIAAQRLEDLMLREEAGYNLHGPIL